MKKGEKSEDERKSLFADLSETEKYMVTMMEVEDAAAKLDAMMFRSVFKSRCEDITTATKTLNLACDELRSSEKLRKLMAVILTVVNQINTGGEGKAAMGFTLDALLKLNEVSTNRIRTNCALRSLNPRQIKC
jgi:formin 2